MDDEPQTPSFTAEPLDPYAGEQPEEVDLNEDLGADGMPWEELGARMVDGRLEYELPEDDEASP